MLKKQNRLKSNSSFKATYCQNRVVGDEFFVLFAGKNKLNDTVNTKIGFVVSKKVHKRAVIRNKIKRRLRYICANYLKKNSPACLSYIFKAKEQCININYEDTLKSVNKLFDKMAKKII